MAVNAANFTATLQVKPSIFEVIAQQSLNDTLHPALERISLVRFQIRLTIEYNHNQLYQLLASNFPEKLSWLTTYYDEVFAVLKGLLEYHYVQTYNASFSENFYGLQRLPALTKGSLSTKQKQLSVLILVLLPYLMRKVESRIVAYRLELAEGSLRDVSLIKF